MFWHVGWQSGPPRLKLIALALLAVPAVVLLLFAFGEMFSGEISGVQHIPEAGLLVLLMAAAWRYPRGVGVVLLSLGSLLLVVWLIWSARDGADVGDILTLVAAALILFVPPLLAGWLLLQASRPGTH